MTPNVNFTGPDIQSIPKSQLPDVIQSQYEILEELDSKLKIAFQKAQAATYSANLAANVKVGWFRGKKKAIKVSQQAIQDLAAGNAANTEVVKVVLVYLTQIADIANWFISLSTLGLATTRATINQLQQILNEGASVRLSDAAKSELKKAIRDLKSKEDFMQKLAKTETAVKQHEKRISKIERSQKYLVGGVALAFLLIVVLGFAVVRFKNFSQDNANITGPTSQSSVSSETDETPNSTDNIVSEIPEGSEEQKQEQQPDKMDSMAQAEENYKPHSQATNTQNGTNSILPEENAAPITPETDTIDLSALEGPWGLRSNINTYVNIFESGNKHYITFVVTNGGFAHYLPQPAELIADGEYAVASYDEDNEGNHGTIKITFSNDGEPLITAIMNDKSTPVYTSSDELLYLIVTDVPMYSNPDMKDYPVYKEYLDPALFGNLSK